MIWSENDKKPRRGAMACCHQPGYFIIFMRGGNQNMFMLADNHTFYARVVGDDNNIYTGVGG